MTGNAASADVLIVGSGAAGMYAALAAARAGAGVLLVDRSLIGRGGATVMAQMTVAVAMGEEEPDHWEHHLADTLEAGRGPCGPAPPPIPWGGRGSWAPRPSRSSSARTAGRAPGRGTRGASAGPAATGTSPRSM